MNQLFEASATTVLTSFFSKKSLLKSLKMLIVLAAVSVEAGAIVLS